MALDDPLFPVNLRLSGRRVLVVGGGNVALRKARALVDAGAVVRIVAPKVRAEFDALTGVTVERRPYIRGELTHERLVIAATGDPAVNRSVYEDGEACGVWVNSADEPENCSFTLPARISRGSLLLTVSTAGRSPALASWLRERLERDIGPEYGALLDVLAEVRAELISRGIATEGLAWREAIDSGMLELVREGNLAEAKERLQACLS